MTSIPLHDYVQQVDKLIDDNRLMEAIEHCRHILHTYPRHIDTYRIMGKAMLEKQDYDAASDLFLRILGTDPNDFISHVGLSIAYKEESQYEQALWHLERAFEIQPYNVAIQGELRQLYAVQTEMRPGVIPLTPGALVRLYMQGELYQQAIIELRRILAEDPSRMDLQVLLAEALWRDDQRIDAEEVCLNVLQELPYCIVVNAILAEIWLQTGRIPEAQKYLQRLHSLTQQTRGLVDRETIVGQAFATEGAFPLPEAALLDYLQTGMSLSDQPAVPTDDWVGEVNLEAVGDGSGDQAVVEPESGMHSYDWLADINEVEGQDTAVSDEVPSEGDWFSEDRAKDELNLATGELDADWLADLRRDEAPEFQPLDFENTNTFATPEEQVDETNWFSDEDDALEEVLAATEEEPEGEEVTVVPEADASEEAVEAGLNDWLDALTDDEPTIQIDSTSLMDVGSMDWADEDEDDPYVVKEPRTPFWLSEMTAEEIDALELNPEEALDWMSDELDEAEPVEDKAVAESAEIVEMSESEEEEPVLADDLDWLSDIPDMEPMASGETDNFEDMLSQEDDLFAEDAFLEDEVAESPALDTAGLGEADDWLAALTEGEIDETLDWDVEEEDTAVPAEEISINATTEEFSALSDADDWLQTAATDLDAMLESEEVEEDEFPNLSIPEIEGDDIADIPDWLDNDNLDLSEESEAAVSSENDPQNTPMPEDPQIESELTQDDKAAESSAFDWLADLASEAPEDLPDPPIETEGMPSWLAKANERDAEVVDEWESETADIPQWLQEPVELSEELSELSAEDDLPAEMDESDEIETGLTGLLSEIEVTETEITEEAPLPLDEMGALLSDWADETDDESFTGLFDDLEDTDTEFALDDEIMFAGDVDGGEDTAVPSKEEPEEVGLTGLLSNLVIADEMEAEDTTDAEEDELDELFGDIDTDGLSGFLFDEDETAEPESDAESDDALSLDDLDLENVSLTQLLSEVDDEPASAAKETVSDEDDWLTDLDALIDEEEESEEADEPEEVGLTGMLAKLNTDMDFGLEEDEEDTEDVPTAEAEVETAESAVEDDLLHALGDQPDDDLGLTDLLAGIDYAEDAIDSDPQLPDFNIDSAPELEDLLADMDQLSEFEPEEESSPISAEDTTWLNQLEADTGSLEQQTDEFEVAGLDWLTTPDEPEEEIEVEEIEVEASIEMVQGVTEADEDGEPEDWNDAMSWLEELAAQQDDPVGELPSVAETMLDEDIDIPADLAVTAADDGDLDWLSELSGDDEVEISAEAETQPELIVSDEDDLSDLFGDEDGDASWLDELDMGTGSLEADRVDETDEPEAPEEWLDSEAELAEFSGESDGADLDWLDTAVETEDELMDDVAEAVDTAVPDEEDVEPLPDEEYAITGVTDALKAGSGIEEAEADLEEALAWLDELDEDDEDEFDLSEEAPPTRINEPIEEVEITNEPETVVLKPEPNELMLALDRLEQQVREEGVAVPETTAAPLTLSSEQLIAALDWIEQTETDLAEAETAEFEDGAEEYEAIITEPALEIEEFVAFEDEAAVSPESVIETDDEEVEDDWADLSDDPEAWLEQLLDGDEEMAVEMEPPPIKPSEDAVFVTDDAAKPVAPEAPEREEEVAEFSDISDIFEEDDDSAGSLLDDITLDEVPDDPDAAVAWLEQLLDDDREMDVEMEPPPIKPSEDAVFVTDDSAASADVVEDEEDEWLPELDVVDEDEEDETIIESAAPEDALISLEDDPEAWLEQMLSGEMEVEMEPPPIKPSEDAVFVTDDAQVTELEPDEPEEIVAQASLDLEAEDEAEEAELDLDFGDMDMEGDAEAWLEQLLSDDSVMDVEMEPPPIKPSEDAVYVTDAQTAEEETAVADETEEAESLSIRLENLTNDIDGEDIIANVPDDPDEAMAWLEQLAAQQGASLDELPSISESDDKVDLPEWLPDEWSGEGGEPDLEFLNELEETAASFTGQLDENVVNVEDDVDIDSELPDWLGDESGRRVPGQTDWLRALPDVDVDTWLSAEEEATMSGTTDDIILPDTGPITAPRQTGPTEEELVEDDLFEPVLEPSTGAYSVNEAKLDSAQQALGENRVGEAITQFKELVAEGTGMMTIIAELEQAVEAHPEASALFQVLGDAYMRNGQLQKALASYRSALDQM